MHEASGGLLDPDYNILADLFSGSLWLSSVMFRLHENISKTFLNDVNIPYGRLPVIPMSKADPSLVLMIDFSLQIFYILFGIT